MTVSKENVANLVAASRVLSAIGGLFAPFIFVGVMNVYRTLDSYGNRLSTLEAEQKHMTKREDFRSLSSDVRRLKEDYYQLIGAEAVSGKRKIPNLIQGDDDEQH